MTHTIELAPVVERVLAAKAERRGMTVEDLLLQLAEVEAAKAMLDPSPEDSLIAMLYDHSLATHGELTALSNVQEDLHEYSTQELEAMAAGEFEQPAAVAPTASSRARSASRT